MRAFFPRSGALIVAAVLLAGCAKGGAQSAADARIDKHPSVPDRPEALVFPEIDFSPPDAGDFRHTLSSGVPVFIAPSAELPLVTLTFTFRGGAYLEDEDKTGLAALTTELIRDGGTAHRSPSELDDAFAFLAADVSTQHRETTITASLDVLADKLDEALPLFQEMLREPGFDAERHRVAVDNWVEAMKRRNDDGGHIISRDFDRLMYGEDHVTARVATEPSLRSVRRSDLEDFHAAVFHPGNLVISVHGDVDPETLLPKLEGLLEGWEAGEPVAAPDAPRVSAAPGLYHVQKEMPQGKVRIGLPGIQREHEDFFPLTVANEILGGGGFGSRIMSRVRSDEGLAYGAWSALSAPAWWDGILYAGFDSKNPTVALATSIVLEEMTRLANEPVPERELEDAKASLAAQLPGAFNTRSSMLSIFVGDEITGRDSAYWQGWEENIRAVTAEDVMRVSSTWFNPENATILVVGDWEPIASGDVEGRAQMSAFGEATHLPLRDPLTQVPE